MTLNDVYAAIDDFGSTSANVLLASGATHVAIDKDGSIFGYKGEPRNCSDFDEEWMPGEGEDDRAVMFCGMTEREQDNWKELVWELP